MSNSNRNHLHYSYSDLANVMGYSQSYFRKELSRRRLYPREMSLLELVNFILSSSNKKKTPIPSLRIDPTKFPPED